MKYYIYKHGEKIVGHIQTNKNMPAPAVAVSEEEYKRLGFYVQPPASGAGKVTELEQLRADVDYIAMETGVDL